MDPSSASPASDPELLSLVLQYETFADADVPSSTVTQTKRSMSSVDSSPPADTQPPRPTSPATRSQRTPPQESRSKLVKAKLPKKPRGLSEVLSQLNASSSISSEPYVEDVNVPSELAAIKEQPNQPLPSPTRKHAKRASISATAPIERVDDMALPRHIMPTITPETKHCENGGTISTTSSMHENPPSSSSAPLRTPMDVGKPSAAPLAADSEQRILLDSVSSEPRLFSPALNDTAKASPKATKQRRRMSFDFASLKQPRYSSPTPPSPPRMQRSQSLWRQKPRSADREQAESLDKMGGLREPMSERQRALNVKRARKMAQVFGTEPPSALYQITNLKEDENEDDALITPVEETTQDPLASILSLSPLSTSGAHRRSSSTSSSVATMNNGKTAGQKPDQSQTLAPFMRRVESPPPSPKSSTLSFKTRRRRAAKLARFFGVGYHDLSESMGLPVTASTTSSPAEVAESRPNPPVTYAGPQSSMSVDVKMSEPTRFWGIGEGRQNMKDASMGDVIGRLRQMKAK